MKEKTFSKLLKVYNNFSKDFWLLMLTSFIDMLGGSLIFPFFSLFLTKKFNVGMTEVGTMFLVWALTSGLIGNTIGGVLADWFGRKANIIFGLIASAVSALMMVIINDLVLFYVIIGVIGIFEDIAGPARQAMIADLVPEELRGDAFGIYRIVFNLAATIAPAIGGFMATRSFEMLFYADGIISISLAFFVLVFLPETKPKMLEGSKKEQTLGQTFKGYGAILRDKIFIIFIIISGLSTLMYFNMNSSMSVYLVNHRGITPAQFGYILTLNAGMVVVFQVFFTRATAKWKPMLAIAFGNLLYVIGFTMYGIFDTYAMFLIAMIIITIGEMIYAPKEQMIVANIAPAHMRGRYMAVRNYSWIIPIAVGPLAAGVIMDNFNPRLVWYAAGFVGLLAAAGSLLLHYQAGPRFGVSEDNR
ncbi:MAG: MFS transporter [Anaerolineaceae bacterium]|nr:MFS transporter [Anaerolineaceae bacterium]